MKNGELMDTDTYLFFTKMFINVTMAVLLMRLFIASVKLGIAKIRNRWINYAIYVETESEIEKMKKSIESESLNDNEIARLEKFIRMYKQFLKNKYGDGVPLSGKSRYLVGMAVSVLNFWSRIKIVILFEKFYAFLKERSLSIYQRIPFSMKNILFFVWIYMNSAALWSVYYLFLYQVIDIKLTTYLTYLPLALILYTIVSSSDIRNTIQSFQLKQELDLANFVLRKAKVVFEIGLPLLTISLLISTIAGFSQHGIQYAILQFLVLIYAPLIPMILSIKLALIEKPTIEEINEKAD